MPTKLHVPGPNTLTVGFVRDLLPRGGRLAEVGVHEGATTLPLLEVVAERGGLMDLFDYQDVADAVLAKVPERLRPHVRGYWNTTATHDSYNWSFVAHLIAGTRYDYVFLDGSHMWCDDALAFFLLDSMLNVGGHVDFDDYCWSIATSRTMNPRVMPEVREHYSEEQIVMEQVPLVIDLCLRRTGRYECVAENKLYRKMA